MNDPTYVLRWMPGYLVKGGCDWGDGWWELQSLAAYEAGEPQLDPDWYIEGEPRDIDAGDFTEWIAGLTGYPVTVEKSHARITCPRALRFWRKEPVWLVRPAVAGDLMREARDWLADCTWSDDPDFAGMTDGQVRRGVDRTYGGGWAAFAADGAS